MSRIFQAFLKQNQAIRTVIARYRSNASDIDELSHDVFLTGFAMEMREDIREPERLLLRIAKNLAINESRRMVNKTSVSFADSVDSSVFADERQVSPEDVLDGRQKLLILSEALACMTSEMRSAFLMKRVEGLKFDQIAERLNVSKSTVEKWVAAGLKQCEEHLKARGVDPAQFGARSKKNRAMRDTPVKRVSQSSPKSDQVV